MSSQPLAPPAGQRASEQLTTYATDADERFEAVLPTVICTNVSADRGNARPAFSSRAALCIFLI